MDAIQLKTKLPTFLGWWEKRQKAKRNQLPKHLRPLPVWPIWIQIVLNIAIFSALVTLMTNKDDYVTDAGPAITMVVCLLFLIFTVIEGFKIRSTYKNMRGQRLAKLNFVLMVLAFLAWPASVAVFLP